MKAILFLALFALGAAAWADDVPPIVYCQVEPWDSMELPRAVFVPNHRAGGYDPSAHATIHVTITDDMHQPLPGLFVEVILGNCWDIICFCDDVALTGYTDSAGQVELNLGGGGCCQGPRALIMRANGVTVREMNMIVSPDWNGQVGDCVVSLGDFVVFGQSYHAGTGGCFDLDGDGATGSTDFVIFGSSWTRDCTPSQPR